MATVRGRAGVGAVGDGIERHGVQMGSKDRLDAGMDLHADIEAQGGKDDDIALVRERRPQMFVDFAKALVAEARRIRIADGTFTTWKTVRIGTSPDEAALKRELKGAGCKVGGYASDLMTKIVIATQPQDVELVRVTGLDLGFEKAATLRDILAKGQALGLKKCVPEVGPQLRKVYEDQPQGEWLWVAMDPVTGSDGGPRVFYVYGHSGKLWLDAYYCNLDGQFDPVVMFVFSK